MTKRFGRPKQPEPVKIRVGTVPAHGVMFTDKLSGEELYVRVPEKPRWQALGTSGIFPKDGGK